MTIATLFINANMMNKNIQINKLLYKDQESEVK